MHTPNEPENLKIIPTEISKKKPFFAIQAPLRAYLKNYSRDIKTATTYKDLTHFSYSSPLVDKNQHDTLWETVSYNETDRQDIYPALTAIYATLRAAGNTAVMQHLSVDRVDYCTFGNSNPFRVKIVNNLNDNYDYFYVKRADASRIYGLELEHILSPNRIHYFEYNDTLIEEHVAGIPGDQFIKTKLNEPDANATRIAKEFVKFNERCFVKLLGDMRAYNFVLDITPDFEDTQYRIRAIDFDQQCYEGKKNVYLPQFFKENYPFVQLCSKLLPQQTIQQYQSEERALIASRIKSSYHRLNDLLQVMRTDYISTENKIFTLKNQLAEHYQQPAFLTCNTMGEIVKTSLEIVSKN